MAGRPTSYSAEMHQAAKDYIADYEKHGHVIPSVVGMAVILQVAKSTLYQWVTDDRETDGEPFSDTLELCEDFQHVIAVNKGLTGEFNATITKLVLANHGYSEKQTIAGDAENPLAVRDMSNYSDEELEAIAAGESP